MIIAVEGIDGAGKGTLTRALIAAIPGARTIGFPRYEESVPAQLAARALKGEMGDLIGSIHGMATIFALDRFGAKDQLAGDGLIILDRYVASNAAYTSARLGSDEGAAWVAELEFGELGLPKPDLTILLNTDAELAIARAAHREQDEADRTRDAYELNSQLQADTLAYYRKLAQENWYGPWLVLDPAAVEENVAKIRSFLKI